MKRLYFLLSIMLVFCLGIVFPFNSSGLWVPPVEAETTLFESSWEAGQIHGHRDWVVYSYNVAGYFNSSSPPPECSRRYHETVRSGNYSLMIAGYSQASYAYCYYRVFDEDIPVQDGLKIGYWIYHKVGTPKVAVDGHFTDGINTIRDFGDGILTDQYGIRIHPGHRQDPMNQWYYVEVDLSAAAGKTIDFIMFAFDNGGDGFRGQYRAYVDDFRIFTEGSGFPSSITGGLPKGAFGSGSQTDEVTEPETWRWSELFYGHQGIDMIGWQSDACGGWHNYAMGWHQGDLIEYLMKFGGDYKRLILKGIADRPGPVEVEIYIDGQYKATAAWDNNDDCNQDVAVEIGGISYGTHAIAVMFVNDYYNPGTGEDRNFYLDGLFVSRSNPQPPPKPSSELYGLCINANYSEQNPPAGEFDALGVRWVRSIRYQYDFTPHGNVKWLVIFNQETIPRKGEETWSNYVARFSDEVKQIVQSNIWISAIEVWNEQDLPDGEHDPGYGRYLEPEEYAPLLKDTYEKVKRLSDPPSVVFGGLGSGRHAGTNYLNQVKQQWGGNIYFDAVGFHPYLATVDGIGWPDRGTMEDNINVLYNATSGRPIWLTEFGAAYQHLGNDKEKQARYLEKCYKLFERLKDGNKRKVEVAFWFAWDDRTHWNPNEESFGLVEQDWSKRPAWWKYYGLTHP